MVFCSDMETKHGTKTETLDLSIVVPVYGSEMTLRELCERLHKVLGETGLRFEVIFVDDASRDRSWEVLAELKSEFPDTVIAVQLMRNYGQQNALMCGFRQSRGKLLVTMDDDLQHPPEEIPKLIAAIEQTGNDLVYGTYHRHKRHSIWRNFGSRILYMAYVDALGVHPTSFRIIRRQLLESIFYYGLNYTVIDGLFAWSSKRMSEIEVDHHESRRGRSRYSFWRLVTTAITTITSFSIVPLRVVSLLGFVAAIGGLSMGLFYLILYFIRGYGVAGFATIIIAIVTFGGLQLMALGLIGEYLGRVHMNINRKPQYTIRDIRD